jgi:hypothetical protein
MVRDSFVRTNSSVPKSFQTASTVTRAATKNANKAMRQMAIVADTGDEAIWVRVRMAPSTKLQNKNT